MKNHNTTTGLTPAQAIEQLEAMYNAAVTALRSAIGQYIARGTLPDEQARRNGLFVYPELNVCWDGVARNPKKTRAYGRFTHPGCYCTTVTRPSLFRAYLLEQLTLLQDDYGATITVAPSSQ